MYFKATSLDVKEKIFLGWFFFKLSDPMSPDGNLCQSTKGEKKPLILMQLFYYLIDPNDPGVIIKSSK